MNEQETAMTTAINSARAQRGVHALAVDERLVTAARGHAQDLAAHPEMTEDPARYHIGSDGSTIGQRIAASGYQAAQYSEVAAWGWQGRVAEPVNFWLNSPNHVGLVLAGDVTDIGVGYATGGGGGQSGRPPADKAA